MTFQLRGTLLRSMCRLNSWHVASQTSDGGWPFFFLSSNNVAFRRLLTPHISSAAPFTRVSEAVHPNSDPFWQPGWMEMSTSGSLWQVSCYCDHTFAFAKLHTSTFPYSSVSFTSSWQLEYKLIIKQNGIWMRNSKRLSLAHYYYIGDGI